MNISWTLKSFDELTAHELYLILQLRNEVFIVEQKCPYQDLDNKDFDSMHLMGWEDRSLIAYTRLLPAGISFTEASIGRVVSAPACRGKGAGKLLMEKSISTLNSIHGNVPIRIGAQLYLEEFYNNFNFKRDSDIYLEDGIEHIEMIRNDSIS